jgi:transposase
MADAPINNECATCPHLRRVEELEARIKKLEALIDDLHRGGKRQAAPFSKGPPKADPKPPGRKPGEAYGPKAYRAPPTTFHEVHQAPLPPHCPNCSGTHIVEKETVEQFQTDIPREPIYRKFVVHVGQCLDCGCRVQGRHPFQTSDAIGAAASQIGPDAQALAIDLNKTVGASHGKIARLFTRFYNVHIDRSTPVHIILRGGTRAAPIYDRILRHIRRSPYVCADETGWRIAGAMAWLWVFVNPKATAYVIDRHRNADVPLAVLCPDYDGMLGHDGLPLYNGAFLDAFHQSCHAHFLERCKGLLEIATRGAVRFPRDVKALLLDSLALRDRRDEGRISKHGLKVAIGRLEARLDRLLTWPRNHEANETFARHLLNNRCAIFTFLHYPGIEATNWRAEQAIRPAVVNRKVWGGNRTPDGAKAQAILMSVLRTCAQQGRDTFDFLRQVLCTPAHQPLPRLNL